MSLKFAFIYVFALFVFTLSVQASAVSSFHLQWKGVEVWHADSSSRTIISFEGAQYINETYLPYFKYRIKDATLQNTKVTISNIEYEPIQLSEEIALLVDVRLNADPQLIVSDLSERGNSFLEVQVLPFVSRDGRYFRLKSFDLHISKIEHPQKISKASKATIHSYASSSVLAQGKFVRIKIKDTGVYKLTYEDLQSMGITPSNVRIFGYGGGVLEQSFLLPKVDDLPQLSIWMEKGSDGVFNAGDYILFYAQGVIRWTFDSTQNIFKHQINPYSNYGHYFVTSDVGAEKLISPQPIVTPPSQASIANVNTFMDYKVFEEDLINLTNSGKEFYGFTFSSVTNKSIPMVFPNLLLNQNSITATLNVAARSSLQSTFQLTLNDSQSKTVSVGAVNAANAYEQAREGNGTFSFNPTTSSCNFKVTYTKSDASSVGYLNYLGVNARRSLIMSGSEMVFRNIDNYVTSEYNFYNLSGANTNVQIWDITNQANIGSIQAQRTGEVLSFYGSTNTSNVYLAIDPTASSSFPRPIIEGVVNNQNLHSLAPVDMVIITHPNFLKQAETLANAHREKSYLTVEVVTTEQVYNEFSSGTPDATAYRWFMKMLYDRAIESGNNSDIPKYLLLFGRGSYDNRKILTDSGDSFVLTYQAENSLESTKSYVTDDYFTFLDDSEGVNVPSHLMDVSVGRFPVVNVQQATDVVNKTIAYMNNDRKGKWKNQLLFIADDGDGDLHMRQADSIASIIGRQHPAYEVKKVYLDAYIQESSASGERYPLVTSTVHNMLQQGVFLLNYTGHAGAAGLSNEAIITVNEVNKMANKHLPIWMGATCNFLQYDVSTISAGEYVVLNPSGGGIGIFSAARPVYASQNFQINRKFIEHLFSKTNGEHLRVGDAVRLAKNSIGSEINKLSYVYIGDPALQLNYPTKYQVITSQINENTTFGSDTLRALSVNTIKGYIADDDGNKVTDFNGVLNSTVYDKVQTITTLDNDKEFPESPQNRFKYKDRPNMIFSGQTTVTDGEFSFTFLLPKDIKYNFGSGKINYYAQDIDPSKNAEAQGVFENFTVGGTSMDFVNETEGPAVQLYLNSLDFRNGDKVNEEPLFIAKVSDINGINTVGSGIGHDVMLTINQDPKQSYNLNSAFSADLNSYTAGTFRYKLPAMQNGKHTLTFKVWDLLNNSTVATLDFEVEAGLTPQIFSVYNYPNPASTETHVVVVHDRPETILSTSIDVIDLSGRVLWSFTKSSPDNITWDLKGSDGNRVKPGIYLYRVNVKTSKSDVVSKTCKMIITN